MLNKQLNFLIFIIVIHIVVSHKITILDKTFDDEGAVKSWIYFTDKIETHKVYMETLQTIDKYTKKRRIQSSAKEIDYHDLPVNQEYINKILQKVDYKNYNIIKWFNAITMKITKEEAHEISKFTFVRSIEKVLSFKKIEPVIETSTIDQAIFDIKSQNYGSSYNQLQQINVMKMHEQGFYGEGIRILVLDTGFQLSHNAFKNIIVNDTYDFIHNRVPVDNHPNDASSQFHHGTVVLGLLAGNDSGVTHGPAPKATYLLAKTEDLRSETPVEEDNFVRAIEWGEQRGAQILSASLGYSGWYSRSDFNGLKGITTKAVNIAIAKGMICVIANGNAGSGGIGVPADAFYAIAVGAVDVNGNIGSFSSYGPTADYRVKPEICARGVLNYHVNVLSNSGYTSGSGTSYATPIVAGAIALLLNKNPNWNPYQVYHAIVSTGSLSTTPNLRYGYGILDIDLASKMTSFPSDLICNLQCSTNAVCYRQACLCLEPQGNCTKNRYCEGNGYCLINGTCNSNICQCNPGWNGTTCAFNPLVPIANNSSLFNISIVIMIISIIFVFN